MPTLRLTASLSALCLAVGLFAQPTTAYAATMVLQARDGRVGSPAEMRASAQRIRELRGLFADATQQRDLARRRAAISRSNLVRVGILFRLPEGTSEEEIVAAAERFVEQDTRNREALETSRLNAASLIDPSLRGAIEQSLSQSQAAFEDGRLGDAREALASIEDPLIASEPDTESLRIAALRTRAGLARQEGDYDSAIAMLLDAEGAFTAGSPYISILTQDRAQVLVDKGRLSGNSQALEEAISLYRDELLPSADCNSDPARCASLESGLAEALSQLGNRAGGRELLTEGIAAARRALRLWHDQQNPLETAKAQNTLGEALVALGQRENGTAAYEEARLVFGSAIAVYDRSRAPLDWGRANHRLGLVSYYLAERTTDAAFCDDAISHFERALQELQAAVAPLDWAESMSGLSGCQMMLGMVRGEPSAVARAVAASREIVEALPRDRYPLLWGTAQNNLAAGYLVLGRMDPGSTNTERAVAAYRLGLAEVTRERDPLTWATMQSNLGDALVQLGQARRDQALLEQGISAIQLSLEERSPSQAPSDWATTTVNLTMALYMSSEMSGDYGRFLAIRTDAREAFRILEANGIASYGDVGRSFETLFSLVEARTRVK